MNGRESPGSSCRLRFQCLCPPGNRPPGSAQETDIACKPGRASTGIELTPEAGAHLDTPTDREIAESGARVCDPQRAAGELPYLSLRRRALPASLLRLTEPRAVERGSATRRKLRGNMHVGPEISHTG